ncbi:hypothetical protein SISSUDRAFT_1132752 [Sistotremastrum suecicum HHB10207 ss-3]|uniref:Uncharacterized protein n=1 Tax=Sistotremastrum suecicum HHB10207 ss-3 TaxID=1314776 RepID=A0A165YCF6_9AGAM|nr:hypothetical protein SISSUDRAFT_1132752 [Sistotremastrum suecicum HHB10207 ss-3]
MTSENQLNKTKGLVSNVQLPTSTTNQPDSRAPSLRRHDSPSATSESTAYSFQDTDSATASRADLSTRSSIGDDDSEYSFKSTHSDNEMTRLHQNMSIPPLEAAGNGDPRSPYEEDSDDATTHYSFRSSNDGSQRSDHILPNGHKNDGHPSSRPNSSHAFDDWSSGASQYAFADSDDDEIEDDCESEYSFAEEDSDQDSKYAFADVDSDQEVEKALFATEEEPSYIRPETSSPISIIPNRPSSPSLLSTKAAQDIVAPTEHARILPAPILPHPPQFLAPDAPTNSLETIDASPHIPNSSGSVNAESTTGPMEVLFEAVPSQLVPATLQAPVHTPFNFSLHATNSITPTLGVSAETPNVPGASQKPSVASSPFRRSPFISYPQLPASSNSGFTFSFASQTPQYVAAEVSGPVSTFTPDTQSSDVLTNTKASVVPDAALHAIEEDVFMEDVSRSSLPGNDGNRSSFTTPKPSSHPSDPSTNSKSRSTRQSISAHIRSAPIAENISSITTSKPSSHLPDPSANSKSRSTRQSISAHIRSAPIAENLDARAKLPPQSLTHSNMTPNPSNSTRIPKQVLSGENLPRGVPDPKHISPLSDTVHSQSSNHQLSAERPDPFLNNAERLRNSIDPVRVTDVIVELAGRVDLLTLENERLRNGANIETPPARLPTQVIDPVAPANNPSDSSAPAKNPQNSSTTETEEASKSKSKSRKPATKLSSTAQNILKDRIRVHALQLLKVDTLQDPLPDPPTELQLKQWESHRRDGPTTENFTVDYFGSAVKGWNKEAGKIFRESFMEEYDDYDIYHDETRLIEFQFASHLSSTIRRHFDIQRPRKPAAEMQKDALEKRTASARNTRRETLWGWRIETCERTRGLRQFLPLLKLLGKEGMSDDDSGPETIHAPRENHHPVDPHGQKVFRIMNIPWRNDEVVKPWLRVIDGVNVSRKFKQNGKSKSGSWLRVRVPSKLVSEREVAPIKRPKNFVSPAYLDTLTKHEIEDLFLKPFIDIPHIPTEVRKTAKRFAHFRSSKDKPMPLKDVVITEEEL